jgi:hypothetical protein
MLGCGFEAHPQITARTTRRRVRRIGRLWTKLSGRGHGWVDCNRDGLIGALREWSGGVAMVKLRFPSPNTKRNETDPRNAE